MVFGRCCRPQALLSHDLLCLLDAPRLRDEMAVPIGNPEDAPPSAEAHQVLEPDAPAPSREAGPETPADDVPPGPPGPQQALKPGVLVLRW